MRSGIRRNRWPVLGFVHIPKTAGTTVKFILRNSTYLRHADLHPRAKHGKFRDDDYRFLQWVFPFGIRTMAGHSLIHPTAWLSPPIRYFTFIRDPLRRCLSHYEHVKRAQNRNGRDISFPEFIEEERLSDHQVRCIAGGPDLEKAKRELEGYLFVGLTERFAESLLVLERLSPHPLNLEHRRLHVAKDNTARAAVLADPDQRRLLEERNRLDLELHAFVRDELYPAFRERAGIRPREMDESAFAPTGYPLRYKLTRAYNQAVYRTASKLRRKVLGKRKRRPQPVR